MKSDLSTCSEVSGGFDSESNEQLDKGQNAFFITISINMQSPLTINDSTKTGNQQISEQSMQNQFQTLICSVEDFLVKHSASLESGEVSTIPEEHCFLKLQELLELKNLKLFSLRTLKVYSITTKGKLLPESFKSWMNWGIMLNGWCLIAKTLEFHKTEKGCLLSEILEDNTSSKYLISEKVLKCFEKRNRRNDGMPTLCANSFRLNESTPIVIDKKYDLSEKAINKIMRHKNSSLGKEISKPIIEQYWRIPGKEGQYVWKTQLKTKDDIATTLPRWYGFQSTNTFITEDKFNNIPLSQLVGKIRRLTPKECERLQAFPDNWTDGQSDTQRYRQLGNAVTVNVVEYIMRNMIK